MADIIDIDVVQNVTSVSFEVEPNTNIININKITGGAGGAVPSLQEVTDVDASTTNSIIANGFIKTGGTSSQFLKADGSVDSNIYGVDSNLVHKTGSESIAGLKTFTTGVFANTNTESAVVATSSKSYGLIATSNSAVIPSAIFNISSASNPFDIVRFQKAGITLASITNSGQFSGAGFIKTGGTSSQFLMADGSISTAVTPTIPTLQQVTTAGATTTIPININGISEQTGLGINLISDANGLIVNTNTSTTIGVPIGVSDEFENLLFSVGHNGSILSENSITSSTVILSPTILVNTTVNNGVDKLQVNGSLIATSIKKSGGTSSQFLMADGSVTTGGSGGVPYTGATSDVNLGEFGIQLGNLEFDNTPTNIPTTAGSVYYNDTDGTLDLILKGGNVKLQIGQEVVIRVVNKTATNISLLESNYQAVRITGAQGQRMKVDLAQATTDGLSAETIGLVTETILNNEEGFITTSGLIRNVNTTGSLQSETWVDGDILYLSPTVAGRITNVKPSAPNHLIIIGYVIHAHATQGTIFVKVDNGYELDELHNVSINGSLANNDVLTYETATSLWKNKAIPAQSFASLTDKPTTISGYGITDAVKTIINEFPNITVNGTTSETLLSTFTILGGTLPTSCMPDIRAKFSKSGDGGTSQIRFRINTVNNFATATQIATFLAAANVDTFLVSRNPVISGGNMNIMISSSSVQSDLSTTSITESNFSINVANDIYLFVSAVQGVAGDTTTLRAFKIIN